MSSIDASARIGVTRTPSGVVLVPFCKALSIISATRLLMKAWVGRALGLCPAKAKVSQNSVALNSNKGQDRRQRMTEKQKLPDKQTILICDLAQFTVPILKELFSPTGFPLTFSEIPLAHCLLEEVVLIGYVNPSVKIILKVCVTDMQVLVCGIGGPKQDPSGTSSKVPSGLVFTGVENG